MVGITCNSRIITLICTLPFRWSTLLPITTSPSSFFTVCTSWSTKSTKSKILELWKTYIWKGFKRIRGKWGDPKISANPKVWTKILAGSGFHYRDENYSTKDIIRGGKIFHSLGAVLLLISCTFLVCHTPKNILNVYDLYRLAVKVRSMRSIILVEVSLHDSPPLSNLGVAADSSQPSPPHHQRFLQHLHLLPEGPKNYSVFRIVFHCFQGVSLRIPSSDLASWNTSWVVVLSVPQSRLCKRLKDFHSKKKGFSGWGEWDSCERVQEAESFRPC